jgi:hypothetical protein
MTMTFEDLRVQLHDCRMVPAATAAAPLVAAWNDLTRDENDPGLYHIDHTQLRPLDEDVWTTFWGAGPAWADVSVFADTDGLPVLILDRSPEDCPPGATPQFGIAGRGRDRLHVHTT